jgi:hypothetical protein
MTDVPPPDPTEELLHGADRPRPLPPELRRRLAERLTAADRDETADPTGARPLPSDLRERLAGALPPRRGPDAGATDAAGGSGGEPGPRRAWRWANPAAAVAAAVLVVAAVVGLSVRGGGSNNSNTTAAAGGASTSSRAAAPPQLSASSGQAAGGAGGAAAGAGGGAVLNGGPAAGQPPSAGGAAAAPAPSVSRLSPATGPTAGGTWVTVTGQNLGAATQVRFGTTPARQLVVVSGTEVRALSPAHTLGTVDVTVAAPAGTSPVTPADRYTFLP